jgi:hypothetical protein
MRGDGAGRRPIAGRWREGIWSSCALVLGESADSRNLENAIGFERPFDCPRMEVEELTRCI